jgi:hypothetical protein
MKKIESCELKRLVKRKDLIGIGILVPNFPTYFLLDW